MRFKLNSFCGVVSLFAICGSIISATSIVAADAPEIVYNRDIQPILAENCFACHGPDGDARKGDLRLDIKDDLFDDLGGYRIIVPGKPLQSELILRVTAKNPARRMPPRKSRHHLSSRQIELLRNWVAQGANWDRHWAFRPILRPALPNVAKTAWCGSAIDRFVLAWLEKDKIEPSPRADRATLIRRLYIDLIGLPPSPADIDGFERDKRPGAYERVVDRLLSSSHFGERWGRHWLDLARYADSDGYEDDRHRPDAWRYRDWVIAAVNEDMPFDQFTTEQIAGDLLPGATYRQKAAAGFYRMGPLNRNAIGRTHEEEFRILTAKDRANTVATVWLGLTLACAQCHDHKYDPVLQRDYYRFFAHFNNLVDASTPAPPVAKKHQMIYRRALKEFERLRSTFGQAGNNRPQPPSTKALSVVEKRKPRKSYVHVRGDFRKHGEEVEPGAPTFLLPPGGQRISNRHDLAKWIVSKRNPLTGRVAVNYVWQRLFGRGLVATPENFGVHGERPSHPDLVDWLAAEFVASGWRRKRLIRLIVTSSTYQQSSRFRADLANRDPANRLLARQNRFRVEAEVVRDFALAAAGLLVREIGGPSVQPPLPKSILKRRELTSERFMLPSIGLERYRRGVYVNVQRTFSNPMLKDFDSADPNVPCPRRERSTTPQQALAMLNDPVFVECAQTLGLRAVRESNPDGRIDFLFRLCLARTPTKREKRILENVFKSHRELYGKSPKSVATLLGLNRPAAGASGIEAAAWVAVARTIINLDEFITRE